MNMCRTGCTYTYVRLTCCVYTGILKYKRAMHLLCTNCQCMFCILFTHCPQFIYSVCHVYKP